jgi:two-component system response regulator RegA
MTAVPSRTILLVEDDAVFRDQLGRALRDRGYDVVVAGDFDEAQRSIGSISADFALIDLKLPGKSGLDVLSEIAARSPRTRAFLLTGAVVPAVVAAAFERGALGCLRKPLDADQIVAELDAAET